MKFLFLCLCCVRTLYTAVLIVLPSFLLSEGTVRAQQSTAPTLVIATTEYPPYTSEHYYEQGFMNHVIRLVMERQGYHVEFVYLPWARAMREGKVGNYDALSYGYYKAEREEAFYVSDNISNERLVFFTRKSLGLSNWKNLDELAPLKMGVTRGYSYNLKVWDYIEANSMASFVVNSDVQNLRLLVRERIDLFPIEAAVGWYLLNTHFSPEEVAQIETLPNSVMDTSTHLMFPKAAVNSKAHFEAFNRGLAELKSGNEFAKMYQDLVEGKYLTPRQQR